MDNHGVGTLVPMSRRTGGCFVSGVNVNLWKRQKICVRGLVYVWSPSRMGWYMVVLTCGWNVVLTGVLGVLAGCVVVCVCAQSVRWSPVGICLVGVPRVGSLCVGMRRGVK